MKCDKCHLNVDCLLHIKEKKYCLSCIKSYYLNILRPNGYWIKLLTYRKEKYRD